MNPTLDKGSFRDPDGFVFYRDLELFRQVQATYRDSWDIFISSGLYETLAGAGHLIAHTEAPLGLAMTDGAYRVIRPIRIPFISYPYEWCFSQLKDAALTTLAIQKVALEHGMSLKDASAYNIQFHNGHPIFIDTLSFEPYSEGAPWVAYRQFCQHFLAPLALMSYVDIRLGQLLRTNLDGIPLDLASKLLPRSTWLKPGLMMHLHQHGAAQRRHEDAGRTADRPHAHVSKMGLLGIIDSLEGTIERLTWQPEGTAWSDYYAHTNYSDSSMEGKRHIVSAMIEEVRPSAQTAWDLGANTGVFSRLVSMHRVNTVAWDIDPAAVEKNYLICKASGEPCLLPLISDLTNPSPDLGWALAERKSFSNRGPVGVTLALALVHHLAIANNIPLPQISSFLRTITDWLIIEFVPKTDTQVKRLLATRDDIFVDYNQPEFECSFGQDFQLVQSQQVPNSERTLYLMRARRSNG